MDDECVFVLVAMSGVGTCNTLCFAASMLAISGRIATAAGIGSFTKGGAIRTLCVAVRVELAVVVRDC